MWRKQGKRGRRRRPHLVRTVVIIAATLAEVVPIWRRGYRFGGDVVVRCRHGHLFTTIWWPAVSIKSIRLGWWRLQRCPVGNHWSLVTAVRRSELTADERQAAAATHDIRLP
jgi:hypothetical protein